MWGGKNRGKKKTKMLLLLEHKPTQKNQTDLDENISAVRNWIFFNAPQIKGWKINEKQDRQSGRRGRKKQAGLMAAKKRTLTEREVRQVKGRAFLLLIRVLMNVLVSRDNPESHYLQSPGNYNGWVDHRGNEIRMWSTLMPGSFYIYVVVMKQIQMESSACNW